MKRILLSTVAVFAFGAIAHADELSDIQAQSKQLREQNQALTKRLADLEKHQQKLEQQSVQAADARVVNPADAMAADLPYKASVKSPAPINDGLCWHGICLYGNFDMGLGYEMHGAPLNPLSVPNDNTPAKNGGGAYLGVGANMMANSFLGLRGKQEIADDLYAVFNLQSTFNPNAGMGSSGIGSVVENNGLAGNLAATNAYGPSPKAGQMFNAAAYFGVSSPTYGTFTMGRQSGLTSDFINGYDPLAGSNYWSVTANGSLGGGYSTQDKILDNSYEYRVNVGPMRFVVEAALANGGNSAPGNIIEGDVGFDYMGLSMDFLGGKMKDSVLAQPLSAAQVIAMNASGINQGLGGVASTVADSTVFQAGARYTIGPWKIFTGYEWVGAVNPSHPLQPGAFIEGGYTVYAPNNTNFGTERIQQIAWFGARYSVTHDIDLTAAYWHEWQNSFVNASNPTGTCTNVSSSACSGTLDGVSLVVDWRFARHFDLFAGMMYSQVLNGLANGYLQTNPAGNGAYVPGVTTNKANNFDPGIGMRYQF